MDKRDIHIKTDYYVTGWMLSVIPHIFEHLIDNYNRNHRKKFKNPTKTLFGKLLDETLHVTLYTFWSEYTNFHNKKLPLDGNTFIWRIKTLRTVIITFSIITILYHESRYLILYHVE